MKIKRIDRKISENTGGGEREKLMKKTLRVDKCGENEKNREGGKMEKLK